jgi:hypothetical protein
MAILKIFMVIWYIFGSFGMLLKEKSGNPGGYVRRSMLQVDISGLGLTAAAAMNGSTF